MSRYNCLWRQLSYLCFAIFIAIFHIYINFKIPKYSINGKLINFSEMENFLPPFINIVSDYFAAPKYNLVGCGIRKSMSQLTISTMCLLYNENNFMINNQTLSDTWKDFSVCRYDPQFEPIFETFQNKKKVTKFAILRDPFERFISLYLDKCLYEQWCYGCHNDLRCYVKNIYETLQDFRYGNKPNGSYADIHAAPISWNCNFDKDISKFTFIIMGVRENERKSGILQLGNLIASKGVPKRIVNRIIRESLEGETRHATYKSKNRLKVEEQVRTDSFVRDYLHKIYLFDYLVFPFDRSPLDEKYREI